MRSGSGNERIKTHSRLLAAALAVCLAAALFSACAGKPEPSPTEPPVPATEAPTSTPKPTPTPETTSTPEPTPAPALLVYRAPSEEQWLRVMLSEEAEQTVSGLLSGGEAPIKDLPEAFDYRLFVYGAEYAYDSESGVLFDVSVGTYSGLTEEARAALAALFGVGAVRGKSIPTGYDFTNAAIAWLDTSGDASVLIDFYNDTGDFAYIPLYLRLFRVENGAAEAVGESGDRSYGVEVPAGVFTYEFGLGACDLSREGLYRICFYRDGEEPGEPSDCFIEFSVEADAPEPPELTEDELVLRRKYPYYFDLDTSYGLDIYVWQMARNSFSFAFLPGTAEPRTWEEEFSAIEGSDHRSVKTETARKILACYGLPRESVRIVPYQNILSSYLMPTGPVFMAQLEAMLFGED